MTRAARTSASDAAFRHFLDELWTPLQEAGSGSYIRPEPQEAMLRSAIRGGMRNEIQLTDLLFFRRHPERNGRILSRDEPDFTRLSQEWLRIRDTLVRPALRDTAPGRPAWPAPTPPASGTGPGSWGGHQNGRIPAGALCPIRVAPGQLLECGAATAFDRMNTSFRARLGQDLVVNDAYRTYERQVDMRNEKGDQAARPGTSNHGWGKAVDLGGMGTGTGAAFDWLTANSSRHGWIHPPWARAGGSNPEPWHWEYVGVS